LSVLSRRGLCPHSAHICHYVRQFRFVFLLGAR
jgi:hypothetical protein